MERSIKIIGTGKYIPKLIHSDELEEKYGIPAGVSEKYSGVRIRGHVTKEDNSEMGAKAVESALKDAGITIKEVDLLISAAGSYDYTLPNQGASIKKKLLGSESVDFPAFNIDSTCISFLVAFDMAARMLDGITYKNIVIVSSETASKNLNPENWETLTLLGDGAAAVVVTSDKVGESKMIKSQFATYSEGFEFAKIPGGGIANHFTDEDFDPKSICFQMNGRNLLRLSSKTIPPFLHTFFEDIEYDLDVLDAIVPHQASKTGLMVFEHLYDFKPNTIQRTLSKYGNCIAASIPLTMCDSIENGSVKRGDSVLLCGTSAGFSLGAVLIKY